MKRQIAHVSFALFVAFALLLGITATLSGPAAASTVRTGSAEGGGQARHLQPPKPQPAAPLRAGGPDGFGYVFTDSNEASGTGTPVFSWDDAQDNGYRTSIADGNLSIQVNLPFSFKFYDNTYNSLAIDLNGYLTFGTDSPTGDNLYVGDATAPNNLVAVYWDYLSASPSSSFCNGAGSGVYTDVVGTAPNRIYYVEWYDLAHYDMRNDSSAHCVTFEAALYETANEIDMQYQATSFNNSLYDNGASATVGLENNQANIWSEYCHESSPACNLTDTLAIAFYHPDHLGARPDLQVSKSGTAQVQPGGNVTYTIYYSNTGSRLASNVLIIDTPQSGLQYVGANPVPDGTAGNVITWSLSSLAIYGSGASSDLGYGSITLYATAPTTATVGSVLINRVDISSDTPDLDTGNNSDTAGSTIVPGPPASVVVSRSPTTLAANDFSTANITVTVKDGAGNNVQDGTDVVLETTLGHFFGNGLDTITPSTSSGVATTIYQAGTVTGTAQITATAQGGTDPSDSTTIALTTATPATITLSADPGSIPADGTSTSVVTAIVSDSLGGVASDGTAVSFQTSSGTLDGGGMTADKMLSGGTVTTGLQATAAGSAIVTGTTGSLSDTVPVTLTGGTEVVISLNAGWNLISFHVTPYPSDTASVLGTLGNNLAVAQGYDGSGQSYYPGGGQNTLTTMDALHGYWLKMNSADTLTVRGDVVYSTTAIPLNSGWNLIGYLPASSTGLDEALSSLGSTYSAILGFNQGATSYYRAMPSSMNTLTSLNPKQGYWLNVTTSGSLCYAGPGNCP